MGNLVVFVVKGDDLGIWKDFSLCNFVNIVVWYLLYNVVEY